MSRATYVNCFLILAFIFVPVYFSDGPASEISPCSFAAFVTVTNTISVLSKGADDEALSLIVECVNIVYLAIYLGAFYLCARLTFGTIEEFSSRALRFILRILVLALLFSASFLNVIHSNSFFNAPGTYDFWDAASRFLALHSTNS